MIVGIPLGNGLMFVPSTLRVPNLCAFQLPQTSVRAWCSAAEECVAPLLRIRHRAQVGCRDRLRGGEKGLDVEEVCQ